MEPYGRRAKLKVNLIDNHIPKHVNWWEQEFNSVEKGRARMKAKKEIKNSVEGIERTSR